MTKTLRFPGREICIFGMYVTVWLFWAVFGSRIYHAVFSLEEFPLDGNALDEKRLFQNTSTDYRCQKEFQGTLGKYWEFGKMYREEQSIAVPGLEYTGIGNSYSSHMVPQGICIAGDFMLISAYDKGSGGKVEPSVIYVLSNDTEKRSFLTTVVLPDVNHVGGITFDGTYVWIAKSSTGYISGISYECLKQAAESGLNSVVLEDYCRQVFVGQRASFITYDDGRIWVGTYESGFGESGVLAGYRLEAAENGAAETKEESGAGSEPAACICSEESRGNVEPVKLAAKRERMYSIPSHAQGAAFLEQEGKRYLALTASYGRYWDSKVYLFEVEGAEEDSPLLLAGVCRFPPMAEELVTDGSHIFFLFESAATPYRTENYRKCAYPVDRVCGVENRELLAFLQ